MSRTTHDECEWCLREFECHPDDPPLCSSACWREWLDANDERPRGR